MSNETQAQLAVKTAKTPASFPMSPALADDIKRAEAALARRKAAPMTSVASRDLIPVKRFLADVCPDSVSPGRGKDGKLLAADWHAFTAARKDHEKQLSRGAIPVVSHGQHVMFEGDPVYKIPTDQYMEELHGVEARGNRIAKGPESESQDRASGAVTESMKAVSSTHAITDSG